MNKEFYKMQKLAGLITENQVTEDINNDKVAFLVDAFQHVWGMGKGNNNIDFNSLAKSTIEDLETRF
jgi:hypothetical protein